MKHLSKSICFYHLDGMRVHAGLPRSGKSQGKQKCFKVSEKSGKVFDIVKVVRRQGIIFSLYTEFRKRKGSFKRQSGIFSSVLPCFAG